MAAINAVRSGAGRATRQQAASPALRLRPARVGRAGIDDGSMTCLRTPGKDTALPGHCRRAHAATGPADMS